MSKKPAYGSYNATQMDAFLDAKQNKLIPTDGIIIDPDTNEISIDSVEGTLTFSKNFVASDIVDDKLTITHDRNSTDVAIVVYGGTPLAELLPESATPVDNDTVLIDLTNTGITSGKVLIIGGTIKGVNLPIPPNVYSIDEANEKFATKALATESNDGLMSSKAYNVFKDYISKSLEISNIVENSWVSVDGVITGTNGRNIVEYNVVSGSTIQINITQTDNFIGGASIISFWTDDTFVSNAKTGNSTLSSYSEKVIVPTDCNIVKLSFSSYEGWVSSVVELASKTLPIESADIVFAPTSVVEDSYINYHTQEVASAGALDTFVYDAGIFRNSKVNMRIRQGTRPIGASAALVSFWDGDTIISLDEWVQSTNVADYDIEVKIPLGATQFKVCMGVVEGSSIDVIGYKDDLYVKNIDENPSVSYNEIYPQVYNGYLPEKTESDVIRVLLIGSSWGTDTILGLSKVAYSCGVNLEVSDLYIGSGSFQKYIDAITAGTSVTMYNCIGDTYESTRMLVGEAIASKPWDVIVMQNNAGDSQTVIPSGYNETFATMLEYVKANVTNHRVKIALNNTWVDESAQTKYPTVYKVINELMEQGGIDLVIPSATAIKYLLDSDLATSTKDVYRDGQHISVGIGRFTAACAAYQALVYPMTGKPLSASTFTGSIDMDGVPTVDGYSLIPVTEENRATCIDCAIKANLNRFKFNI